MVKQYLHNPPTVCVAKVFGKVVQSTKVCDPQSNTRDETAWENGDYLQEELFESWMKYRFGNNLQCSRTSNASLVMFDVDNLCEPDDGPFGGPNDQFWVNVDKEITSFIANDAPRTFSLDRSFIVDVAIFKAPSPTINRYRNVQDVRYFRLDQSYSVNGRELYLPYTVLVEKYNTSLDFAHHDEHFIFAPCNVARDEQDNPTRNWRPRAYNLLKDVPHSIVTLDGIPKADFNLAMRQSTFCFILPGDTPSTSKLYKAIFAGCIPVVFVSFYHQLPFSQVINWSAFAVVVLRDIINAKEDMEHLVHKLQAIRADNVRLHEMRHALSVVRDVFDYSRVEFPSPYDFALLSLLATDSCAPKSSLFSTNRFLCLK
jgi:hypothetical protein